MARIVILGGGTAGTVVANRLARRYRREMSANLASVTVIDQDDRHLYQPGLLYVPFGSVRPPRLVRSRRRQLSRAVRYLGGSVNRLDVDRDIIELADGRLIPYDVLVIATGTRLAPEETDGLTGAGWRRNVHEFYTLEGATALREALSRFDGGRLVINPIGPPIKGPAVPLAFSFLADSHFTRRGIRDRVEISYVTSLDGVFTPGEAEESLAELLAAKGIGTVTRFDTGSVDGEAGELRAWDGRTVPFDLLVAVPLHVGQDFVGRTPGLGDDLNFVHTDPLTLRAERRYNVFALGDATDLPVSKVGSVVHAQADVLVENIARYIRGDSLAPAFDGHASCVVDTGYSRGLLIDFNYHRDSTPGAFPLPFVGPLSVLRESRINFAAKQLFRWLYWHRLLPGRGLPGLGGPLRGWGGSQGRPATYSGTI